MKAPSLPFATALFAGAWTIHSADHMRRGVGAVRDGVLWGGTGVAMLTAVLITLVIVGHEIAPLAIAASGPAIAIGVSASHLVPDWGPFSDYLLAGMTDWITTVAVLSGIAAGLIWGWSAFVVLRRHGYEQRIPQPAWNV